MTKALTSDQRAWLSELGTLVSQAPAEVADDEEATLPDGSRKALAGERVASTNEALVGFGPEDIPGAIAKKLLGPLNVTCMINNNTGQSLKVDRASLSEIDDDSGRTMGIAHGEYQEFPPSQIKAEDQSAKFSAANKETDLVIVTVRTAGVEGFVRYFIDEQKTAWVLHFNNPRVGNNTADSRLEGPNAAQFETPSVVKGGGNNAKFLYVLNRKGGTVPPTPTPTPPNPTPTPIPTPAAKVPSSCLISVTNETGLALRRADADHERGDFMMPPPASVPPGGIVSFVSVETLNAKEQGCKGFVVWEVGSPVSAVWRIEWDNPEEAKNNASASLTPQTAGFASQDVIGQGEENVPVSFIISGGTAPVPPPGPVPVPPTPVPPKPEPEFLPPVEQKQPTLRKGDKSVDQWVEYAQFLLNHHLGTNLAQDGDFGNSTLSAVTRFQGKKKLLVDGIIGNQTWAALRDGAPEKPSTDGREPHAFVEAGPEARWTLEKKDNFYDKASDTLQLIVESVGDTPLDPSTEAIVKITPPGGKARTVAVQIGPVEPSTKRDQGFHVVRLKNFRKEFPSVPATASVTGYQIDAYLPQELGGDRLIDKVTEL